MLGLQPALQLRTLYSPRPWLARPFRTGVFCRSDPPALFGAILKFLCLARARRRLRSSNHRNLLRAAFAESSSCLGCRAAELGFVLRCKEEARARSYGP